MDLSSRTWDKGVSSEAERTNEAQFLLPFILKFLNSASSDLNKLKIISVSPTKKISVGGINIRGRRKPSSQ